MPLSQYVALGSNTTVKSGAGTLYGFTVSGANGGTVIALDSVSIGAPNFNSVGNAVPSNLAYLGLLGTAPAYIPNFAKFQVGLTVAATSNANFTVNFD